MKTEALEVLKNRRSIRKFKPEQITDEELNLVLEAGTYAPTAGNQQSPVIVAIQDPETVAYINELSSLMVDDPTRRRKDPYFGAPTIIIVLGKMQIDAALVTGNLLNAAYAVGLGSCYVSRVIKMFKTAEGKALLRKWGLPEDLDGVCSIALGYSDMPHPEAAPRKKDYIVRI